MFDHHSRGGSKIGWDGAHYLLMIKATEADKSADVLPTENKSNLFSTQSETFTPITAPSEVCGRTFKAAPRRSCCTPSKLSCPSTKQPWDEDYGFSESYDSVDFQWKLLAGSTMDDDVEPSAEDSEIDNDEDIKTEPY